MPVALRQAVSPEVRGPLLEREGVIVRPGPERTEELRGALQCIFLTHPILLDQDFHKLK